MMLQGADPIFFALLRSGLYGTPLPESKLPESIDWTAVIRLAKKHVVYGIIIDSIPLLPERLRPSGDVAAEINRFALGLIRTNMILDLTVARLSTFLGQHGIHGVLLKGPGVARYYRMPQMRQSSDIDFYVGTEQYAEAVRLCRANLAEDSDQSSDEQTPVPPHTDEQHFGFYMSGVYIELHRLASKMFSPGLNRRFQLWAVEQLEHSPARRTARLGNADVTLPPVDFDAIFIFYHAWRHYIEGGIGLRQLCDWAMIFHTRAADIDVSNLKETIRRLGLTKPWKLFACIAVTHLGAVPDKIPLYDPRFLKKSRVALAKIMAGGNFGFYTEAFRRTRRKSYGISYGFFKLFYKTRNFFSLFSIIPAEATSFYFAALYHGTIAVIARTVTHKRKNPAN